MISARDAIVLGSGYHLPDRNAFLISTKTILDDTCRYCSIPKPDKGVVRMATESIFYMELVKSDAISFKMIGRDDLKLKYMPSSLLNYLSQGHLPFDLMKTVHRTIRNFDGSEWEKMIEQRGAFYSEIEDKVHEQLEKWDGGGGSRHRTVGGEAKVGKNDLGIQRSKDKYTDTGYRVASRTETGGRTWIRLFLAIVAVLVALIPYHVAIPDGLAVLVNTVTQWIKKSSLDNYSLAMGVILSSDKRYLAASAIVLVVVLLAGAKWRQRHMRKSRPKQSIATEFGEVGSGHSMEGILRKEFNSPAGNVASPLSKMSDITTSPQSSPMAKSPTVSSHRSGHSSAHSTASSKKSRKSVRSTLGSKMKGLKRVASLRPK
jgi:hypothetical protein